MGNPMETTSTPLTKNLIGPMMIIKDLFDEALDVLGPVEVIDPFQEGDVLREAQLLDIWSDVATSTAAFLFEFRGALQIYDAEYPNTGVLVAWGISKLELATEKRETSLTAWTAVGATVSLIDTSLQLKCYLSPNGSFLLNCASMKLFLGDVNHLAPAPPDYTDRTRSSLVNELPQWDSEFDLKHVLCWQPSTVIGVCRCQPKGVFQRNSYEIALYGEESGDVEWRQVTKTPALLLEPYLGSAQSQVLIQAADQAWERTQRCYTWVSYNMKDATLHITR
jgi:hypothetical protein